MIALLFCNVPIRQRNTTLWKPSGFAPNPDNTEAEHKEYFKSISHHPVENTFHSLKFGSDEQNIHTASPGENVHMMQPGISKRTVETFLETIRRSYRHDEDNRNYSSAETTTNEYDSLRTRYGGYLTHQSDRNFPRCKFVSSVLVGNKKEW